MTRWKGYWKSAECRERPSRLPDSSRQCHSGFTLPFGAVVPDCPTARQSPIARLPGLSKHGERMSEFSGLFIPATTPFDAVTGDVAVVHFRNNVRKWLEEPIDGFVLFGSTGEGVLIDDDEKTVLIESARELIPAGRKLVVGITADSTRAIVKKARHFAQAGADAFLIAAPPYFGQYLSPAALADHYRAVADGSPAPILIYHIPKYTKVVMDPALVGELVRHGN